ncbi:MAG: hypothetical protein WC865_06230 [Bacteroidales bacterium]
MKKCISLVIIPIAFLLTGCQSHTGTKISFIGGTSRWIFSNGIVNVVVKPAQGVYEIIRTGDQKKIIAGAYLRIDKDSINEPGRKAQYGGMEDAYSTTAAAYRTVYQLARTGLGSGAFLDERNLDHGCQEPAEGSAGQSRWI